MEIRDVIKSKSTGSYLIIRRITGDFVLCDEAYKGGGIFLFNKNDLYVKDKGDEHYRAVFQIIDETKMYRVR